MITIVSSCICFGIFVFYTMKDRNYFALPLDFPQERVIIFLLIHT